MRGFHWNCLVGIETLLMRGEGLREVQSFFCSRQGWAGASLHSRGLTALMITRILPLQNSCLPNSILIFPSFLFLLRK
jgi:hypothetical protein